MTITEALKRCADSNQLVRAQIGGLDILARIEEDDEDCYVYAEVIPFHRQRHYTMIIPDMVQSLALNGETLYTKAPTHDRLS